MRSRGQEIGLSVVSLLRLLAVLAWASGLAYTIFSAIDYAGHSSSTFSGAISTFCFGLMMTIPAGGVLFGLSAVILSLDNRSKASRNASAQSESTE